MRWMGEAMPQTPHIERHFTAGETVRDIVIGMSDGLTVPFALAAGLSGAVSSTAIILTAGLAEIAAGSIAMGLGGYLAARSDAEHYASERIREQQEIKEKTEAEKESLFLFFSGLQGSDHFGHCNPDCFTGIWLYQGSLYRRETFSERASNSPYWRACRSSSLPDRSLYFKIRKKKSLVMNTIF